MTALVKTCSKCGVDKPTFEFYASKSNRDRKQKKCIQCVLDETRERRNDPEFIQCERRRATKRYGSVRGRAFMLLRRAMASPDGCTLTVEDVIRGIERGFCPATGIRFDLTHNHQRILGRTRNPYAPSLDRIDPRCGYTPENTRVVIWQYNAMKGEISDEELLLLCHAIVQRSPFAT